MLSCNKLAGHALCAYFLQISEPFVICPLLLHTGKPSEQSEKTDLYFCVSSHHNNSLNSQSIPARYPIHCWTHNAGFNFRCSENLLSISIRQHSKKKKKTGYREVPKLPQLNANILMLIIFANKSMWIHCQ